MKKGAIVQRHNHLTIQNHELGKYMTQLRGFWSSPFPACSSFQACASYKFVFVPSHTARPVGTTTTMAAVSGSLRHSLRLMVFSLRPPGCAGAKFDSLPLCISCCRWTCSRSWWAATQNGGWSGQKSCRSNKMLRTKSTTTNRVIKMMRANKVIPGL